MNIQDRLILHAEVLGVSINDDLNRLYEFFMELDAEIYGRKESPQDRMDMLEHVIIRNPDREGVFVTIDEHNIKMVEPNGRKRMQINQ